MCGIAGILGEGIKESELKSLLDPIQHRGEISYRYETYINTEVALGTHRLGIVEESSGAQPFKNHDNQVIVIFNGQIYNHNQLRQELSADFEFKSKSDGETILYAYLKWGLSFVDYLDGKFAIAIYDGYKKRLILARDPMGVKPLYYSYYDKKVFFSSELKSLVKHKGNEILELLPGCLWVDFQQKTYFSLKKFNSEKLTDGIIAQKLVDLKECLKSAVIKRVNDSNQKIACLLSGGVDSSIITYLATQNCQNVIAYTLSEPNKNSEDLKASILLTNFLKIKHVIVSPSIKDMSDFYLKYGVYMTETFEPVLVRNAVSYYFLCKKVASDGFKHCLNGEGADELFGGYDFVKEAPKEMQDALIMNSLSIIHNSYLRMADRASMFATLEARVPYMDKKLIKLALSLPPQSRVSGNMSKVALRAAFKGDIPNELIDRKKVGMNEGAGFGVNNQEQSIYYNAVKSHYENKPGDYKRDYELGILNNKSNDIDLSKLEEVYNFARFIELGFINLQNSTKRLQLNTSLQAKFLL